MFGITWTSLRASILLVSVAQTSLFAQAKQIAPKTEEQLKAAIEAHKHDFDYLLGDWEFSSESREFGKGRGYWSAVRLEGGHVLDEYRVVGDHDETWYHSATLRTYNAHLDRWDLVSAEQGQGLQNVGSGRKVGAEMHIEQTFGAMQRPSLWRIRYYNIRQDGFSWAADRSTDGGKSWVKDFLTIEARRIGPARSLPTLAPVRTSRQ